MAHRPLPQPTAQVFLTDMEKEKAARGEWHPNGAGSAAEGNCEPAMLRSQRYRVMPRRRRSRFNGSMVHGWITVP